MDHLLFQTIPAFFIGIDHQVALWFHGRLTDGLASVFLRMSDPGSCECVAPLTALTGLFLAWKRLWRGLAALGMSVPGGMLLNEMMKDSIQRHRPFASSPYIDLGGYSFPSGHTMAATLLYGMLAIFAVSVIKSRRWQLGAVIAAMCLILTVAFSRVALGAHYVTDVTAAILVSAVWLYFSFNAAGILRPARVPVEVEERE